MTHLGSRRSTLARSARPWALLLSCLLLAAQSALLTHEHSGHADGPAPAEHSSHACDLCVAFAAVGPAPAAAPAFSLPPAAVPLPPQEWTRSFVAVPCRAHRTRAPPAFHSA